MYAQPSAFFGQPSASAIGFHIAITTGKITTESPCGAIAALCPGFESHASFKSVRYASDAGLNTAGSTRSSKMSCIASPEPIALPSTVNGAPDASFGFVLLNSAICSSSHCFFSLLYTTSTRSAAPLGALAEAGPAVGRDSESPASGFARLQPAKLIDVEASAANTTSARRVP